MPRWTILTAKTEDTKTKGAFGKRLILALKVGYFLTDIQITRKRSTSSTPKTKNKGFHTNNEAFSTRRGEDNLSTVNGWERLDKTALTD